jgi:hypothetical protein
MIGHSELKPFPRYFVSREEARRTLDRDAGKVGQRLDVCFVARQAATCRCTLTVGWLAGEVTGYHS